MGRMLGSKAVKFVLMVALIVWCECRPQQGCPDSCERNTHCCQRNNIFCCHENKTSEQCVIEKPRLRSEVNTVIITRCLIPSLSQNVLDNITSVNVTRLYLWEVAVGSIADNAFKNFSQLKELQITCTGKYNVDGLGTALNNSDIKSELSLSLNECGINNSNINLILQGVSSIKLSSLNLARNSLSRLPLTELEKLKSLRTIDLTINNISDFNQTLAIPHVTSLILDGNRLGEMSPTKWSMLNYTFPNLEELVLSRNSLSKLESTPSRILPKLSKLDLHGNHIIVLDLRNLSLLGNLTDIDLSNNWLNKISNKVQLHSLKRLSLGNNNFGPFPPWWCENSTAHAPNLEYLDLSFNLFRYAVRNAWRCLKKLKHLDLSGNPFFKLKNNSFLDLENLNLLNLSYIMGTLIKIEKAAFNVSSLKQLDLQRSGIIFGGNADYTGLFTYLGNLKYLDLSYNRFYKPTEEQVTEWFSPLKSIEGLNLTYVGLYRLPTGLLGRFPNLTHLNLAMNNFESRDLHGTFNTSVNLQYLSLSKNYIRVVTSKSFVGRISITLKELDLSNNPFDCNCDNLWFRQEIGRSQTQPGRPVYKDWPDQYRCRTPVGKSEQLFETFHPTHKDCQDLDAMLVAYVAIGSFVFVFSVTAGLVYKFRWHITYWRYKIKRKTRNSHLGETAPLLTNRRLFDAYIIYRHEDENICHFIKSDFEPLVRSLGYDCFYLDRHGGFGAKVEEMSDGIYKSRNVIAVVNSSFLRDSWCKFQTEVALDKEMGDKRQLLMYVVLDDVDFRLLNRSWCVKLTRSPTAEWCTDTDDIKRKVLESKIKALLGDPGPKNRHAIWQQSNDTTA